jgi:hypothetical protein
MIQVHDDDFQLIKTTLESAQSRLRPIPGTLTLRSTILLCLAKMGLARRGYPETDPTAEEYIYISQDTSAPAHLRTVAQSHPVHSARIGDDTVEKEDRVGGIMTAPFCICNGSDTSDCPFHGTGSPKENHDPAEGMSEESVQMHMKMAEQHPELYNRAAPRHSGAPICDRCFKPQSGLPGDCTCA